MRALCLACAAAALGGCSLLSPYIPVTPNQADLVYFGRTPRFRCPSTLGRITTPADRPRECEPGHVPERRIEESLGCPKMPADDLPVRTEPRFVRCSYKLARSYLQDRFDSASVRAEELQRLGLLGRTAVFVGLAGAAGNTLFEGARRATLSWGYAAGVGYAASQGFIPEPLAFAYSSGAYAFACVLRIADEAWAAAPANLETLARPEAVSVALTALQARAAELDEAINRAEAKRPPPPIAPGSQMERAMRMRTSLAEIRSGRDRRFAREVDESPRASEQRYELILASAVVSTTDSLATTINNHVQQATPTLQQVRDLAMALKDVKVDDFKAKAGDGAAAKDTGGTPAAKTKIDEAADAPTKPPQEAAQHREDPRLQSAINDAVAAARELRTRLAAGSAPDFSSCVPPVAGAPLTPASVAP